MRIRNITELPGPSHACWALHSDDAPYELGRMGMNPNSVILNIELYVHEALGSQVLGDEAYEN